MHTKFGQKCCELMHIWMPNNHSILLNPVNWSILFGVVVWEGVNTFLVPKSYFGPKIVFWSQNRFFYPQIGKTQFVDQFSTDSGTKKNPKKLPFPQAHLVSKINREFVLTFVNHFL